MSVGLMCDCPLPPMKGLTPADRGHTPRDPARHGGKPGCAQYAEDQENGGMCRFCAYSHRLVHFPFPTQASDSKEKTT